jgi:hypothetical protein
MKIYNDDEKKFGGEMYDILDIKLRIFYDCCAKIGMSNTQYHNAFSVMFKGRAATFYYDKLSNKDYRFENMLAITRIYFETEKNRQFYILEWKEITLPKIILNNLNKTRLECFKLMFNKL